MLEASAARRDATGDPAHAAVADRPRRSTSSAAPAAAVRRHAGFTSPVPYPASADPFPHRLAGLAAMIAAGLPLEVVAITSPGHFDTHAPGRRRSRTASQLTADSLLAFQRDLEARGLADRVLVARLVGVRPPRAGERLGRHRPRLRRHRVPDRHARAGQMIGVFPGLTAASTPSATSRRPPTSAASTPRSSSSGSAPTRRRSSRTPVLVLADDARPV